MEDALEEKISSCLKQFCDECEEISLSHCYCVKERKMKSEGSSCKPADSDGSTFIKTIITDAALLMD